MSGSPFFTVIVVALNAEDLIADTINSILKQSCDDYEIIVKDGLSKDRTISRIPCSEKIRIISEKDISIYDAMNQAVMYSKGRYINFLNCGDIFYDKSVLENVKRKAGSNEHGFIYGNYIRNGIIHKQPSTISKFYSYRTPLCHQTVFFNGDLLRNGYFYLTEYKILADYDLELRIIRNATTMYVDEVICSYLGGGVSESEQNKEIKKIERNKIVHKHFSTVECLMYQVLWMLSLPHIRAKLIYGDYGMISKIYQNVVNRINR